MGAQRDKRNHNQYLLKYAALVLALALGQELFSVLEIGVGIIDFQLVISYLESVDLNLMTCTMFATVLF